MILLSPLAHQFSSHLVRFAHTYASPSMHRRCVYAQKSQTSHPFEGAGTRGETSSGVVQRARSPGDALEAGSCATHNGCVTTRARLYAPAAWIRLTATLIYSCRCLSRAAARSLARACHEKSRIEHADDTQWTIHSLIALEKSRRTDKRNFSARDAENS